MLKLALTSRAFSAKSTQISGIFAYHDTRPGGTSMRGQERSTGGVIRGVAMHESHGIDIERVNVFPTQVDASSAKLLVEVTVRNWGKSPAQVKLDGEIAP